MFDGAAIAASGFDPIHDAQKKPRLAPAALGFEIQTIRLKMGITQAELASQLGIRRTHLSDIERGLHLPRNSTLIKLREILGIEI
jgi:DNA-binding XRE family transcriptional regulator